MQIEVKAHAGHAAVGSIALAKMFGKRHDHVLRDIDALIKDSESQSPGMGSEMFVPSVFRNSRNREYREFLVTRDGFTLLAMGFVGPKALGWKLKYIAAFNEMERLLKEQNQSVMKSFGDAIAKMESDKALASVHGKALSEWKRIRKQHIQAVTSAHEKAQLVLNYGQ